MSELMSASLSLHSLISYRKFILLTSEKLELKFIQLNLRFVLY